ncbi:MAG: hypothetical protein IJ292_01275 [Clostridia bacterium]|nr:hypothetical protein [Clostridia bacterium]
MLIVCVFVFSSCQTIDGYYYSLEKARNEKGLYKDADYVFSEHLDDAVIDFIIKENALHIVQIGVKGRGDTSKYRVRYTSSYLLDQAISEYNNAGDYVWSETSKLSLKKISWCVVSKEFNKNNNLCAFDFIYNETSYLLCYDIVD